MSSNTKFDKLTQRQRQEIADLYRITQSGTATARMFCAKYHLVGRDSFQQSVVYRVIEHMGVEKRSPTKRKGI